MNPPASRCARCRPCQPSPTPALRPGRPLPPDALTPTLRLLFLALLATSLLGCRSTPAPQPATPAPPRPTGQTAEHFEGRIERPVRLAYLIHRPAAPAPNPTRAWPLLIFLHGAGERGDNLDQVAVHGPPKLVKDRPDFPFVVVSPQCPADRTWNVEELEALLAHLLTTENVDPDRVCLTGLSMGGYGTWAWIGAHPERFAAAVPICGGGDPIGVWLSGGTRRATLSRLPLWVFHGAKDNVVPLAESERMIDAYRRIGNQPKLTVDPNAGHDSWSAAYANPELFDWLLQQRRR